MSVGEDVCRQYADYMLRLRIFQRWFTLQWTSRCLRSNNTQFSVILQNPANKTHARRDRARTTRLRLNLEWVGNLRRALGRMGGRVRGGN
jgi:hypothetical protein